MWSIIQEQSIIYSVELVAKMVQQLSDGKAAGIDGLTIEHIKYCHPLVIVLLKHIFNIMQQYNYVPDLGWPYSPDTQR